MMLFATLINENCGHIFMITQDLCKKLKHKWLALTGNLPGVILCNTTISAIVYQNDGFDVMIVVFYGQVGYSLNFNLSFLIIIN